MKLTNLQLIKMYKAAKDNGAVAMSTSEAVMWVKALQTVLAESNEELYVFPKNYNSNIADPNKFIDISGKLEVD